jgi:protein-tyrosine phosphatase
MSYAEAVDGKVRMLSDYLDADWPRDVPDPYYGGDEGFDQVLDMLEAACPKLLAELGL